MFILVYAFKILILQLYWINIYARIPSDSASLSVKKQNQLGSFSEIISKASFHTLVMSSSFLELLNRMSNELIDTDLDH